VKMMSVIREGEEETKVEDTMDLTMLGRGRVGVGVGPPCVKR
jgi:hypothetical protein